MKDEDVFLACMMIQTMCMVIQTIHMALNWM